MEPIITEQIEKFQSGDFSGYESFYYATSQTVYTMLHTIIPDENTAAELMRKSMRMCRRFHRQRHFMRGAQSLQMRKLWST